MNSSSPTNEKEATSAAATEDIGNSNNVEEDNCNDDGYNKNENNEMNEDEALPAKDISNNTNEFSSSSSTNNESDNAEEDNRHVDDYNENEMPCSGTENKSNKMNESSKGSKCFLFPTSYQSRFRIALLSNIFFLVAAALYLWMASLDVQFAKRFDSSDYSNYYWYQLPQSVKDAAGTLGYDEETWNSAGTPTGVNLDYWFECLPTDLKDAAVTIGYTAETWNGADAPATIECDDSGEQDKTIGNNTSTTPDTNSNTTTPIGVKYYNMAWDDITPEAQEAAKVLGYDQSLWDGGGFPEEADYWFECLPADFLTAAQTLGYDAPTWNGVDAPAVIECDTEEETDNPTTTTTLEPTTQPPTTLPDTVSPTNLPTTLSPTTLSPTMPSPTSPVKDKEPITVKNSSITSSPTISPSQATSSPTISPSRATSSPTISPSKATSSPTKQQTNEIYYEMAWDDLPKEAKDAAKVLGFNQNLWDGGGFPEEADYWFECLPADFLTAAQTLGYDAPTWNGADAPTEIECERRGRRRHALRRKLQENNTTSNNNNNNNTASSPLNSDPYVDDADQQYRMIYIFAAIGFIIVGILDWALVAPQWYPLLFVVAGAFGLASALYTLSDPQLSVILSLISIHFFFLEAIAIVWHRSRRNGLVIYKANWTVCVADGLFFIGSTIELVLAYIYLFNDTAPFDMTVVGFNLTAQILWFFTALFYFCNIKTRLMYEYDYDDYDHKKDEDEECPPSTLGVKDDSSSYS